MCVSSNEYKRNYKVDLFKKYKMCPICTKDMSFYLEDNIAGALGVFECKCGYRDASIDNANNYATSKEWKRFWESLSDIMC